MKELLWALALIVISGWIYFRLWPYIRNKVLYLRCRYLIRRVRSRHMGEAIDEALKEIDEGVENLNKEEKLF